VKQQARPARKCHGSSARNHDEQDMSRAGTKFLFAKRPVPVRI